MKVEIEAQPDGDRVYIPAEIEAFQDDGRLLLKPTGMSWPRELFESRAILFCHKDLVLTRSSAILAKGDPIIEMIQAGTEMTPGKLLACPICGDRAPGCGSRAYTETSWQAWVICCGQECHERPIVTASGRSPGVAATTAASLWNRWPRSPKRR